MKISREIALLRACLRELLGNGNGGTMAKLVRLEDPAGEPVFVDPESVEFVEPQGASKTRINFDSRKSKVVKGKPEEVRDKLEQ